MAKKKIILFDLDGTLIDSTEAIYESFCFSCRENGLPVPILQEVKKTIGHTLNDMFSYFGATKDNLPSFVDSYREYYLKIFLEKTKMLPNATTTIELASEFALLGVVTTKTSNRSRELLQYFDVLKYFHTVVGIEDVKFPKPDKEPILTAIHRIDSNTPLSNIFMVGDTILDAKSAIESGVHSIGLACGYGDERDLQKMCDNVFGDSLEAVKYIHTL